MQCPYSGGNVVYRARFFVDLFNTLANYEDDNVCLQEGIFRLAQKDSANADFNKITLIPNPANEKVNVFLNKKYEGVCKITITDAVGKDIFKQTFDCSQKQFTLKTNNYLPGVYSVQVIVNNELSKKIKLIIVR